MRYSGTGIAFTLGVSVRDLALDSRAAAFSMDRGVSKATLTAAASSELKVTGISGSALASPAASPAFAAMNLAAMRGER